MRRTNERGVSPVVGVMLMLVVTVIIAAVVSAFAGGLSGDTSKTPKAQIRATYSQSDGMTIEHMGGDALATQDIIVMVRPTNTFGNVEHLVSIVNKSTIVDENGLAWVKDKGSTGVSNFAPGDTNYIKPPYHEAEFLQSELKGTGSYALTYYGFSNPDYIGRTFIIEFADDSGKVFAQDEVTISA